MVIVDGRASRNFLVSVGWPSLHSPPSLYSSLLPLPLPPCSLLPFISLLPLALPAPPSPPSHLLRSASPGALSWSEYPPLCGMMEMVMTNTYTFPPSMTLVTAENGSVESKDGAIARELQVCLFVCLSVCLPAFCLS